jgi:hypothetical protein
MPHKSVSQLPDFDSKESAVVLCLQLQASQAASRESWLYACFALNNCVVLTLQCAIQKPSLAMITSPPLQFFLPSADFAVEGVAGTYHTRLLKLFQNRYRIRKGHSNLTESAAGCDLVSTGTERVWICFRPI